MSREYGTTRSLSDKWIKQASARSPDSYRRLTPPKIELLTCYHSVTNEFHESEYWLVTIQSATRADCGRGKGSVYIAMISIGRCDK